MLPVSICCSSLIDQGRTFLLLAFVFFTQMLLDLIIRSDEGQHFRAFQIILQYAIPSSKDTKTQEARAQDTDPETTPPSYRPIKAITQHSAQSTLMRAPHQHPDRIPSTNQTSASQSPQQFPPTSPHPVATSSISLFLLLNPKPGSPSTCQPSNLPFSSTFRLQPP